MSTDRGMGKEDVVRVYNAMLRWWCFVTKSCSPSHKKEWNNAICSSVDAPGDYRTKWSKSDWERSVCEITHMWKLIKTRYEWTCLQNRNRHMDIENKLTVIKGETWRGNKSGAWDEHKHTTIYYYKIASEDLQHRWLYLIFCDSLHKNLTQTEYIYTYNWITMLYPWN